MMGVWSSRKGRADTREWTSIPCTTSFTETRGGSDSPSDAICKSTAWRRSAQQARHLSTSTHGEYCCPVKTPSDDTPTITRRDLLQSAGIAAGVALSVPLGRLLAQASA